MGMRLRPCGTPRSRSRCRSAQLWPRQAWAPATWKLRSTTLVQTLAPSAPAHPTAGRRWMRGMACMRVLLPSQLDHPVLQVGLCHMPTASWLLSCTGILQSPSEASDLELQAFRFRIAMLGGAKQTVSPILIISDLEVWLMPLNAGYRGLRQESGLAVNRCYSAKDSQQICIAELTMTNRASLTPLNPSTLHIIREGMTSKPCLSVCPPAL